MPWHLAGVLLSLWVGDPEQDPMGGRGTCTWAGLKVFLWMSLSHGHWATRGYSACAGGGAMSKQACRAVSQHGRSGAKRLMGIKSHCLPVTHGTPGQ